MIEAYINDKWTDPVTGEELSVEDLIELRSATLQQPRAPTQTSIPALLSTFQNEWDALAVETFELKKQLAASRQQLATAIYDYEGALRILAQVTKERDEARAALSRVRVGEVADADGMDVDQAELPAHLSQIVDETAAQLSKSRRKRPVPSG